MSKIDEFIASLRSELGTRFLHQGRYPGRGLDCAGLVVIASSKIGIEVMDNTEYTRRPDSTMFIKYIEMHCDKVDEPKKGDVLLFNFDGNPQHVAVLTDDEQMLMIHAYMPMKKVVEHRYDQIWKDRLYAVYRPRDIQ